MRRSNDNVSVSVSASCFIYSYRLKNLLNFERPAYGTVHAVDALLMRGGFFIDWTDDEKVRELNYFLSVIIVSSRSQKFYR